MQYLKTNFIAKRATGDEAGHDIQQTYLRKNEKATDSNHADTADNAVNAASADKATNDALGREISKTYVATAGGKVEGELHVQQPSDDDRSDKPATTSWTANLLAHTLPSKKEDGSLQTWDINVSGNAATATKADEATEATHAASADSAKEAEHAEVADTASAVQWDAVQGKPDMNEYSRKIDVPALAEMARALKMRKELGVDAEHVYSAMNSADFERNGIYHIWYGSGDALPKDCTGDLWIFKLNDDTSYGTMIAVTPRTNNIYIGHFSKGVWQGWQTTQTKNQRVDIKEPRLTVGAYAPNNETWRNQLFFMDKNDMYYGYLQGVVGKDFYATEIGTSNTTAHNNNVYFRTEVNKVGVRYTRTNSTIVPEGIYVPTGDNGHGNFWIE